MYMGGGGGGNGRLPSRNVLGGKLEPCNFDPITGYFRNGCCDTAPSDTGSHTVCIVSTAEFLAYSKSVGNDLSTSRPEYGFVGLQPGDRWCLCAARWTQAFQAGYPPQVSLKSTHEAALAYCRLEDLKAHAVDLE